MNIIAIVVTLLVLGVIVGNIMLLKHSAKFPMTRVTSDPIEQARNRLEEKRPNENE